MSETSALVQSAAQSAVPPEFFKAVLDMLPSPVFYKDVDGRYLGCNQAYEQFYGITSGGIIGKTVFDIAPQELAEIYAAKDQQLFATPGVQEYESQVKDAHGVVHDVIFSKSTFRDNAGNIAGLVGVILDITERKRAEKALQDGEQKYHQLFDNANDAIFIADTQTGIILDANQAAERLLGKSREEILGSNRREIHPSGTVEKYEQQFRQNVGAGHVSDMETEVIRKDGTIVPVRISARVLTIDGQQVVQGIFRDITEQIKAEEVLRESQERYNQLVDNTETGYVMLDERGVVIEANEPYQRLVGAKTMDQVVGHSVIEWTAPAEKESNTLAVEQCEQQGYIRDFETIYLRQDGTRVNVLVNAIVQKTPTGKRIVSFLRDITKRKLAEAALRRSEENLSEILNSLDGLVYVTDMKTYETLFVNKYGKETWGDFTGKTCWQSLQTGQTGPCSFCTNDHLLNPDGTTAGVYVWEFQNTITRKWYECRDSAILWPDGRMVRLEIATDITDRKQAEKLVEESEAKYRMLVEHQGEGIVIADLDEQITYCNPAAEQIFGVAPGTLTGRKVTEFIPASAAARLAAETGKRRQGEKSKYELDIVRPSGVARTIMVTGVPQTSVDGGVIGTLAILQDVSEQKRAQEILRVNEEKYRSLFANMLNGFAYHRIITDETGRAVDYVFLEVNGAFERMTGLTSGDITGKRMTEVMPDLKNDAFDWVGAYGRVALDGQELKTEQYSQALDKWFSIASYSTAPGFFVTVFEDITERVNLSRAMKDNQVWLETIFNSIKSGVMVLDRDAHTIVFANQTAANLIGASPELLTGRLCHSYVCPAEQGACPITDKGHTVDNSERTLLTVDGKKVPIIKSVVEATLNGRPVLVESFVDITQRKLIEMELKKNNDVQNVLGTLLRFALEDHSLDEILSKSIDLVLSIPWLALESRGSVFLVEDEPGMLVMKAQRNLAEPIRQACARVPFGKCHCGQAALSKQIEFTDCLGEKHEISYDGIKPHGHYCVPIMSSGNVMGVINLYVRDGHQRNKSEELFLTSMANALAGIIQRKRMEDELRKLSSAVEQSANIIVITDLNANIVYVNTAFEELTGYLREEVIGKNPRLLKSGEMSPVTYKAMWQTLAIGGTWNGEFHNKKKSGELYWEKATITSIKDDQGKPIYYMAVKEDITKQRHILEALAASEERFRQVAESSEEWIWEVDPDGLYTYCSPIVERITGYAPCELVGKIHYYDLFAPEVRDELREAADGGFAIRAEIRAFINPNVRKDGRIVIMETNGVPYYSSEGAFLGYRGTDRDITMRQTLEEERERLIAELQDSLDNIKTLKGLVPICSSCKKIRDDKGYWQQVEEYVSKNTEAEFSHGLCDECAHKLYPEYFPDKKNPES